MIDKRDSFKKARLGRLVWETFDPQRDKNSSDNKNERELWLIMINFLFTCASLNSIGSKFG